MPRNMSPKEWTERLADEFGKDCKKWRQFVTDNSAQVDAELKKPTKKAEIIERILRALED